jgi:hypothetical protein
VSGTGLPSTRILQSWVPLSSVQFNARYGLPVTWTVCDHGSGTQVLVFAGSATVGNTTGGAIGAANAAAASKPESALGRGATFVIG